MKVEFKYFVLLFFALAFGCNKEELEAPKSSDNEISSFIFEASNNDMLDNDLIGHIEGVNITTNEVAYGTDRSKLVPTIKISDGATIRLAKGEVANFTSSVSYVVVAEDGIAKKVYTVRVPISSLSEKAEIVSFIFKVEKNPSLTSDLKGDILNTDIRMMLPYGVTGNKFTPTINVSLGATVNPPSEKEKDFSTPVHYEVTTQDGKITKTYKVTTVSSKEPVLKAVSYYEEANRIGAGDFDKTDLFELSNLSDGSYSYTLKIGTESAGSGTVVVENGKGVITSNLSSNSWKTIPDGDVATSLVLAGNNFNYTVLKEQYKVKSWQDLQGIKNDLGGDYILENDIVFPNPNEDGFSSSGFSPLGSSTDPFTGTFDGQYYVISNFCVNRPSQMFSGVFGYASGENNDDAVVIKNVGVETSAIGVNGGEHVGGLVGYIFDVLISDCYSTGSVVGIDYVGGLVSWNDGEINNCYSTADVTCIKGTNRTYAGGLVGVQGQKIKNCYATGKVIGNSRIGGLIGINGGPIEATAQNCYSRGSVEAKNVVSTLCYIGGLVGENSAAVSRIENCYATGFVKENTTPVDNKFGGFVGYNHLQGKIKDSYYDLETSGQAKFSGGGGDGGGQNGSSTKLMKKKEEFEKKGWDFSTIWDIDETGVINEGYPFLRGVGVGK